MLRVTSLPQRTTPSRRGAPLVLSLALIGVLLGVGSVAVLWATATDQVPGLLLYLAVFGVLLVTYPLLGALIAVRRPAEPFGWIFLAVGLGLGISVFGSAYLELSFATPRPLPLAAWFGWFPEWLSVASIIGGIVSLLLLYPTGRLPSPGWRRFAIAGAVVITIQTIATALAVEVVGTKPHLAASPMLALPESVRAVADVAAAIGTPAIFVIAIASLVAIWRRFRRSSGVERQQLKWLAWVAIPMVIGFLVAPPYPIAGWDVVASIGWAVGIIGLAAIPLVTTIAILRHGLWEIDTIINRTLVYGALSAVLAAMYAATVLALQGLLDQVAPDDTLAVAASTLLVVAAFGPVRRRIQHAVDRRFYRSRYDAGRVIAAFSAQLRDDLDPDAVASLTLRTARQTVQPRSTSLWLRPTDR